MQLIDARNDKTPIKQCELQEWDFKTMRSCLKKQSLYSIAKTYGLTSIVKKPTAHPLLKKPSFDSFMRISVLLL